MAADHGDARLARQHGQYRNAVRRAGVIDIDVDDQDAGAIKDSVLSRLGPAPCRFRSNTRRVLLLYRAAEGEPENAV